MKRDWKIIFCLSLIVIFSVGIVSAGLFGDILKKVITGKATGDNSTCIPNCVGKDCGDNGCGGSCGTCLTGYKCNTTGKCEIVLKANGVVCISDSECTSRACDYDIFTENSLKGNINAATAAGLFDKYCHSNSSKCLFYSGTMEENNVDCTRCGSWMNLELWNETLKGPYDAATCDSDPNCAAPWVNFVDTCGADSKWVNYSDCAGNTPYCSLSNPDDFCSAICVECGEDSQCLDPTKPYCVGNKCVADVCVPSCVGKTCGNDGCNGICGNCSTGEACNSSGACNLLNTNDCIFENPKDSAGNYILLSKYYFKNNFLQYAGKYCQVVKHCSGFDSSSIVVKDDAVKACRCDPYWGCSGVASKNNVAGCINDVSLDSQWERVGSVTCINCPEGACSEGCVSNCAGKDCGDDDCGVSCGSCSIGYKCNSTGQCAVEAIIPISKNEKNMTYYSDKKAFLISDKNWEDVLQLIPLTTWTQQEGDSLDCQRGYGTANGVCTYPTLIYHEESGEVFIDLALGAIITASSTTIDPPDGYHPAQYALDGDVLTDWNSGKNEEGYLKLDLKEIKQFNRIDVYEMAEPYFIDISVSQDDISYQNIIENYPLKDGIGFSAIKNVFTFDMVNARYIKFTLTDNPNQDVYPNYKTIAEIKIYGEEKYNYNSFDADSVIYFMQQYNTEKATIIGETPQELDNLLIAQPELGAGIENNNIQRISVEDYLSYWDSYKEVVYVEDNYEIALIASTYASLINAPLIVEGSSLDVDSNFEKKSITCVGNVQRTCKEQYNLEQLQKKYINETNTDKIILVNSNDLNIKVEDEFQPDKSAGKFYELYSRTSLASPILASAKHEVIISTTSSNSSEISTFIKNKINKLMPWMINNSNGIKAEADNQSVWNGDGYLKYKYFIYGFLTIFSAPNAIPSQEYTGHSGTYDFYVALDQGLYGDIYLEDKQPDLAVGRIQGITSSDVSSYIARDLFYNKLYKSNNMLFAANPLCEDSSYCYYSIRNSNNWTKEFTKIGYDAECSITVDKYLLYINNTYFYNSSYWIWIEEEGVYIYKQEGYSLEEIDISSCNINETSSWLELYKDNSLISFIDHGATDWAGIKSWEIPYLTNSVIYANACYTCATHDGRSFCNNAIRKGSLGFMGAVSASWSSDKTLHKFMSNIYKDKLSLGQSFSKAYSMLSVSNMYTLVGDPALNLNPFYMLGEVLPWLQ